METMTQKEHDLIYEHKGDYRGWVCIFTGCGFVTFEKNGYRIDAHRSEEVINWIEECWREIKERIDDCAEMKEAPHAEA